MDSIKAISIIKRDLNQNRLVHSLGVHEVILEFAIKHNIDAEKAAIAALFHDYAKGTMTLEQQKEYIITYMNKKLLDDHPNLYHGYVAADILKNRFNYHDNDVYDSIFYHVSGNSGMSDLAKILYISDVCEPNRPDSFDKETIKQETLYDINEGLRHAACVKNRYVIERKEKLHNNTVKLLKELGVY